MKQEKEDAHRRFGGRAKLIDDLSSMTFRLDRSEMDWLKQHGREENLVPGRIMRSLLKIYRYYVVEKPTARRLLKAMEEMDCGKKCD